MRRFFDVTFKEHDMFIKFIFLARNLIIKTAKLLIGVAIIIWTLIPNGGSFFGVPSSVFKTFVFFIFIFAILGSCARACSSSSSNNIKFQEYQYLQPADSETVLQKRS